MHHQFITLKQVYFVFQHLILSSNLVSWQCNIFAWNWNNAMQGFFSALSILMAWCFSTRASIATLLDKQICVSSCLWVMVKIWIFQANIWVSHSGLAVCRSIDLGISICCMWYTVHMVHGKLTHFSSWKVNSLLYQMSCRLILIRFPCVLLMYQNISWLNSLCHFPNDNFNYWFVWKLINGLSKSCMMKTSWWITLLSFLCWPYVWMGTYMWKGIFDDWHI